MKNQILRTALATTGKLEINNDTTSINGLIASAINFSLFFIAAIAVMGIIYSGVLYITSAGNPDQVKKAKNSLLWSIAGIIIIILSIFIVGVINDTFINEIYK